MYFIYLFKNIEKLSCDLKGNFFYDEMPIKKYYRTGQIYLRIEGKRYGLKSLKKLAYKSELLPF